MAKTSHIEPPRRFYREVAVAAGEGGYRVLLDGRTPKSPAGTALILPTEALAALVASEWEAQGETIVVTAMPATRLAFTAIDRTPGVHAETAAEIAKYAGADLLCYFADVQPALTERQAAEWGPLLDWARDDLGVELERASGISHRAQNPAALAHVAELADALDDFALTALGHATGLFGSALLAFALQRGRLNGEAAFALSRLDETFQEERWGVDAEAAERTVGRLAEAVLLERWFKALGPTI